MSFYNESLALNKLFELQILASLTNIQKKHDILVRDNKLLKKQNNDLTHYIFQNKSESNDNTILMLNAEIDRLKREIPRLKKIAIS